MDSDELRDVAGGITEWARRVRELRSEEGYQIQTHNDRGDLRPGQYILEDPTPIPAFERAISKETRAYVLNRNGFTCQMCGAVAGETHPYDHTRKTRLYIGHIVDKSQGGTDDLSNLRAILTLERPSNLKLLAQVRRAKGGDQIELLKWLVRKYPQQTKEFLNEEDT